MARAYSLDLRKKVINFILQGGTKREAARIFDIGEDSVYRWIRRYNAGDLKPKKRIFQPMKVNIDKLRAYVEQHTDHTLTEIGTALCLGRQTVCNYLNRLKITRKKKRHFMRKVVPKNVPNLKHN